MLVDTNLRSVEGLAYDQISKILYFVNSARKQIEMVGVMPINNSVNGTRRHHMRKKILGPAQLGPQVRTERADVWIQYTIVQYNEEWDA